MESELVSMATCIAWYHLKVKVNTCIDSSCLWCARNNQWSPKPLILLKTLNTTMAFKWCKSILTAFSIHLSRLVHSKSYCQGNSSQSFTCESKLLIVYRGCISVTEKGTKFISGRWASSRWLTCSLDPRILTVMKDDVSYKIKNFLVLPAPIQGPKDQCEIPDWIHCGIIRSP